MGQTAERVSHTDISDNYVFQRSLLAYHEASSLISGNILEIGTGAGYGVEIISPKADHFLTIDKFDNDYTKKMVEDDQFNNVTFMQMTVPPLTDISDNSLDFVISFQVIEHIKKDDQFVAEIYRVLKKGGKFIVTTPNKKMSLTRNPWHIREYTTKELDDLLRNYFNSVQKNGVFGLEKANQYYEKNKASVQRITRFDILNLQYNLPRFMLQIPYDIMNRRNRKKLLKDNNSLSAGITMEDFCVKEVAEDCLDLFYIAEK